MNEGIFPLTELRLEAGSRSSRGDPILAVTSTTTGDYVGRVDLGRRDRLAPTTRSTRSSRTIVTPKADRGDRALARDPEPASSRTSRSASAPPVSRARHGPRVRHFRRTMAVRSTARCSSNSPSVAETVERFRSERSTQNDPLPRQSLHRGSRGASTCSCKTSSRRAPVTGPRFGPPGRRQDRDDGQLRRRLVRRLHATARRRRLGRLSATRSRRCCNEFAGHPVAGGTLPAIICSSSRRPTRTPSRSFDSPPYQGGASTWVVRCDGKWQLDNGYCRGLRLDCLLLWRRP